jgi:ribA/ribD-fused uncharacterized protein
MLDIIDQFRGKYSFLSNFYIRRILYKGHWFPSNEHAYHSEKSFDKSYQTQLMVQEEIDRWNRETKIDDPSALKSEFTAMESKKFGNNKRLIQKGIMRNDWFNVSLQIMYDINIAKFTQHKDLQEKLLATKGAVLVEGNYWNDKFWGMCRKDQHDPASEWIGENRLGKILMSIRDNIKN